jgi:hypothetical protein
VVCDLEQVDVWQVPADELGIDALLDVAREQEAVLADLAQQDDRHVVDRRPAIRGSLRHAIRVGPEDAQADVVEAEPIAGREAPSRRPAARQRRRPRPIAGSRADHARLVHPPDPVSGQERRQARNVVLVRVGEDEDVDPAIPRRQPLVQRDEQPARIRPAVDDEAPAAAALHEDAVALPDVEDDDPRDPVRSMRQRHGKRDRRAGERKRDHPRRS